MTDTYKISVIIPFFNAVKYINQCLESLALQDFKFPYEIIMIDDCSTDESLKLIKNHKNFNLKIFQLSNNSGPSAARNIGLSKANGNYIFFLDIDDIIEKNTLSKLYETALEKDYDLVFCDKKWIQNFKNLREEKFDYNDDKIFTEENFSQEIKKRFYDPLYSGKIFGLTGRLIKKSIIAKNKILFDERLRYLEDDTFMWDIIPYIKKAKYIRKQLYSYFIRPNENTALSEGINKGFPIENFKIVRQRIYNCLQKKNFSHSSSEQLSNQGFIFFIISALISFSRSILQGKIEAKKGKIRLNQITCEIVEDSDVRKAILNYKISSNESWLIPKAIKWRIPFLLNYFSKVRAKKILEIRKSN
jgi:glycosyltransferase involved in cell wall biosynthesis